MSHNIPDFHVTSFIEKSFTVHMKIQWTEDQREYEVELACSLRQVTTVDDAIIMITGLTITYPGETALDFNLANAGLSGPTKDALSQFFRQEIKRRLAEGSMCIKIP